MNLIKTEYKQRTFDNKWMLMGMFLDEENSYSYETQAGNKITIIPKMWLVLKVFDYELEFINE